MWARKPGEMPSTVGPTTTGGFVGPLGVSEPPHAVSVRPASARPATTPRIVIGNRRPRRQCPGSRRRGGTALVFRVSHSCPPPQRVPRGPGLSARLVDRPVGADDDIRPPDLLGERPLRRNPPADVGFGHAGAPGRSPHLLLAIAGCDDHARRSRARARSRRAAGSPPPRPWRRRAPGRASTPRWPGRRRDAGSPRGPAAPARP